MATRFFSCAHCESPIKQGGLLCPSCGRSQKRGGATRLPGAVAVALGLAVAGCGDKDDDDTGSSADDTGYEDTDEDTDVDETGGADYGTTDTWGITSDDQYEARLRLRYAEQAHDTEVDSSVED